MENAQYNRTRANRRSVDELCGQVYISENYALLPFSAFDAECDAGHLPCGIVVGVVCSGTVKLVINGRNFELRRDALFLLEENARLDAIKYSKACEGYVVCFSNSFLERIAVNLDGFISMRAMLGSQPCREFTSQDVTYLHNITAALSRTVGRAENPYNGKIISSLFSSLFYALMSSLSGGVDGASDDKKVLRSELLFHSFTRLLAEDCVRERSVEYYAKCLNITPKYLSVICRKHANKSASTIIDEAVVRRAKELLSQSGLSVQEVAEKMNFASQSFFGKYFKQRVGVSPSMYKLIV